MNVIYIIKMTLFFYVSVKDHCSFFIYTHTHSLTTYFFTFLPALVCRKLKGFLQATNSPSFIPTISSLIVKGMKARPLWTSNVTPTIWGRIVEERAVVLLLWMGVFNIVGVVVGNDEVIEIFEDFLNEFTWLSKDNLKNGPFHAALGMCKLIIKGDNISSLIYKKLICLFKIYLNKSNELYYNKIITNL